MRKLSEVRGVMWKRDFALAWCGVKAGVIELPTGVRANIVAGENEEGWEHVSVELCARRLPTWEEMCYIKDLFWDDEEEVVQIHPKRSDYVNMAESLHLWRPVNGNWTLLND